MEDNRTPEQVIADYLKREPKSICIHDLKRDIDPYDMAILLESAGFEDVTYMDEEEVVDLYSRVLKKIKDDY